MTSFYEGFEKRAGLKMNLIAPQPLKNVGIKDKIKGWLNRQSRKAAIGMPIVGAAALAYGGMKGIDKLIGTPVPTNEW